MFKELLYGGYKKIQGIWTTTRQKMTTPARGTETIMEYRNTEKMHTYKSVVSIDLVLRNSFYLLLLGILAMLGIACLSSTACADEASSSVQVQKGESSVIQGDPFAVEGDSFDSLLEDGPELSMLDEDDNEFALGGYLES
ncbi:hypothetical protein ADUPG1_001278, partial [Aduncisulcus paluster]